MRNKNEVKYEQNNNKLQIETMRISKERASEPQEKLSPSN
jgi:hypothetical protein